jgi:hypothetical protein
LKRWRLAPRLPALVERGDRAVAARDECAMHLDGDRRAHPRRRRERQLRSSQRACPPYRTYLTRWSCGRRGPVTGQRRENRAGGSRSMAPTCRRPPPARGFRAAAAVRLLVGPHENPPRGFAPAFWFNLLFALCLGALTRRCVPLHRATVAMPSHRRVTAAYLRPSERVFAWRARGATGSGRAALCMPVALPGQGHFGRWRSGHPAKRIGQFDRRRER